MSAADRRKYRRPHIADEGRDYDDRDAEITRLRAELAAMTGERDKWHGIAVDLAEALAFYADPDSYCALTVIADRPCGGFADDISMDDTYGRHMPGAKARAALADAALREGGD